MVVELLYFGFSLRVVVRKRTTECWACGVCACIKFEVEIRKGSSVLDGSTSSTQSSGRRQNNDDMKEGMSFIMCEKLVQVSTLKLLSIFFSYWCCVFFACT